VFCWFQDGRLNGPVGKSSPGANIAKIFVTKAEQHLSMLLMETVFGKNAPK